MIPHDSIFDCKGALIVGAGLAGLFTALKMAPRPVTVLSPMALGEGASSAWAQGGIAAALAKDDSAAAHAADTVAAGAGTVDTDIAASVAAEAAARVEDLAGLGTPFDRDGQGHYVQSREAAHSAHRVARVKGDRAGFAIMQALIAAVRATPSIQVVEGIAVDDLALSGGRVAGVFARLVSDPWMVPILFRAPDVVLATGGIGGLYHVTSNPARVRGQGLGMAARAGAVIADPEFVQFHPTGIAVDRDPAPLASEALRGEGAVLIDETGARFMTAIHQDAELAPRDVVARAIHQHIAAGHKVFLDTRQAIGADFAAHFPTIAGYCAEAGIDPVTQPIPVAPIQHYHMGGVLTDETGETSLDGLWAVGEVACTGLHGANRLASNSLLEAVVFGARIAGALNGQGTGHAPGKVDLPPLAPETGVLPEGELAELRQTMTAHVGVERGAAGLRTALATIARLERQTQGSSRGFLNMLTSATLIAAAALGRRESRGGHQRADFPETDPAQAHQTRITLADALAVRDQAQEAA
ncbi:MAG: L-aspartate oxidase [Paracoccaceae bacterium]|nr:L-aspartate oxidase [Paracoccaceae bacterium]